MLVLSREVQAFIRACEYLLSMPSSPPLSDDEGVLVDYYIQELSNKYGAPKEDRAGSAESLKVNGAQLVSKHRDTL